MASECGELAAPNEVIKTITGSTDDFPWPAATAMLIATTRMRMCTCACVRVVRTHTEDERRVLQQCQKDRISENSWCVHARFY